jgi:hypothetical protein
MKRLARTVMLPKPKDSEMARELLFKLAHSKLPPEALWRAIPSYPPTKDELDNFPRPISKEMFFEQGSRNNVDEDIDSFLAETAEYVVKSCIDCWDLLRPDTVKRLRSTRKDDFEESRFVQDNDAEGSPSIVGKHSWALLEWFILLFEHDQASCKPKQGKRT